MKTVALRFAENFAPECGTIAAHKQILDNLGSVWYGKLGSPMSKTICGSILDVADPKILLIHSGGTDRWWLHVDAISRELPSQGSYPEYYGNLADKMGCWLHVCRFEKADQKVMSKCVVISSGKPLSLASRRSMSPYFIIDYQEESS